MTSLSEVGKRIEGIYVELDVLLDTRLGTLARISQEAAEKQLLAGHVNREHDWFADVVDMDEYTRMYNNRDADTLPYCTITAAVPLLSELSVKLISQINTMPYYDGIRIVVNMCPYELSLEEQDEIGKAVAHYVGNHVPVELTYIKPESLTPAYCKQNFAMMLMYDYNSWMNLHQASFKDQLQTVTLLAPMVYFKQKPTEEEIRPELDQGIQPFMAIERFAKAFIDLNLIDVKYFSILTTLKSHKAPTQESSPLADSPGEGQV